MYDVVIIGAGVSGCSVARELSRYRLDICVVERQSDVCEGTSKANSAIVHAGFDAAPGSLMAKLNVQGNKMMAELSEKLDFSFKKNGSMVACQDAEGVEGLKKLMAQGIANGVEDMEILMHDEAVKLEPNLSDSVYAVLYAPTGGIVCPFNMTIALAENAAANGVTFKLETEVLDICREAEGYRLVTNQGDILTKCVINAAGVYADKFHNMVSEKKIHITPRRGSYCLLDKSTGKHVSHTIFQLPTAMGKGVLVSPTVHGNLLVGPTAVDIEDKDNIATSAAELQDLQLTAGRAVTDLPLRQVITSFAGLRAHEDGHEFVIGEVEGAKGFFDVAGIESPGLSSAPAVGVYVKEMVVSALNPEKKDDFIETRKGIVTFAALSKEEQKELIQKNPAYARVICRCETVTEGEIIDAIRRPLGARTLDGVKRRTRAGMGRCQAGFCTPKVMEILARELGVPMDTIQKNGSHSKLIVGVNKDRL